jgi:hypothetical protein
MGDCLCPVLLGVDCAHTSTGDVKNQALVVTAFYAYRVISADQRFWE